MALLDFSQVASPVPLPRERPSPVPLPRPRPPHTPGLDWSAVASPAPETPPAASTLDWSAVASPIEYGSAPVPPVGGGVNPMVVRQPGSPAAPLVDRGLPPVPGAGVPQPVASVDLNASPMVSHAPQARAPRPMGPLVQGTGEPGESAVTRIAQAGLEGANANEPIGMAYDGAAEQEVQRAFGYGTPQYFIADAIFRAAAVPLDLGVRAITAGAATAGQVAEEVGRAIWPDMAKSGLVGTPEQLNMEVRNLINWRMAEAGMKPVGEAAGSARSISPEIQRFLRKAEEIPPPPVPETPTSPIAAWARSYERKALPPPGGVRPVPEVQPNAPPQAAPPNVAPVAPPSAEAAAPPVAGKPPARQDVAPPAEAPAQGAPPPVIAVPPRGAEQVSAPAEPPMKANLPSQTPRELMGSKDIPAIRYKGEVYTNAVDGHRAQDHLSILSGIGRKVPISAADEDALDFGKIVDGKFQSYGDSTANTDAAWQRNAKVIASQGAEKPTPPSAPETAAPATPAGLVKPAAETRVTIRSAGPASIGRGSWYDAVDVRGTPIAQIKARQDGDNLVIDQIVAITQDGKSGDANSLGFARTKAVLSALANEFPSAKTISGIRNGARGKAALDREEQGKPAGELEARVPIPGRALEPNIPAAPKPLEGEIISPADQLVQDEVYESLASGHMDQTGSQSAVNAAIAGVQDEIDTGGTHAPNGAPWKDVIAALEKLRKPKAIEAEPGSPAAPVKVKTAEDLATATARVEEPATQAHADEGEYRHGHISVQGIDIAIETPKGAMRRGVGKDGKPWQVAMPASYGRIKKTVGQDGEQVDVYVGDKPMASKVYVIDQVNADTKKPDEHKALIGFPSRMAAVQVYRRAFSDNRGGERIGGVTEMTVPQFKDWLKNGDTTKPIAGKAPEPATAAAEVKPAAPVKIGPDLGTKPTSAPEAPAAQTVQPAPPAAPTPAVASREARKSALREIGKIMDAEYAKAAERRPPYGTISVGSADFDHTLKAETAREFLSALGKGQEPADAAAHALKEMQGFIKEHNKKAKGAQFPQDWKRYEGGDPAFVDRLRGIIERAGEPPKPAPAEKPPAAPAPNRIVKEVAPDKKAIASEVRGVVADRLPGWSVQFSKGLDRVHLLPPGKKTVDNPAGGTPIAEWKKAVDEAVAEPKPEAPAAAPPEKVARKKGQTLGSTAVNGLDDPALHGDGYPRAGKTVSGMAVRDHVPNLSSIDGEFTDPIELPGIREVPMSYFPQPPDVTERTKNLAEQIKDSGEVNPLIVAVDSKGPWILEGGHRYDALKILGKETFPAVVVADGTDLADFAETKLAESAQRQPVPRVKLDPRQVANLEKALTNIVHRVFGKNVGISFKSVMRTVEGEIGPEYRSAMDRFAVAGGKTGSTMGGEITWNSNGEAVIRLATQDPKFSPRDSAYHEAYHGVEGMLMTDAEFAAVTDAKEMAGVRKLAAEALGLKPAAAEALPGYEARAIAFQEYARRRDAGEAIRQILPHSNALSRFFEKLRHLLATIRRMLTNKGFKRFEDIFEDVYRGKMAERPRGYRDLMDMGATAEPAVTKARAFKEWFGASKVVDAEGKPLVVYHGTQAATDFDAFKRKRNDIGIHFGTAGQANDRLDFVTRMGAPSEGARIIPVYLSIKRPLRMDDIGFWNWDNLEYGLEKTGKFTRGEVLAAKSPSRAPVGRLVGLRDLIESKGYDGIVYKNHGETTGGGDTGQSLADAIKKYADVTKKNSRSLDSPEVNMARIEYEKATAADKAYRDTHAEDSFIAFHPTQIKSIANQGTFAPTDANILRSTAERSQTLGDTAGRQKRAATKPPPFTKANKAVRDRIGTNEPKARSYSWAKLYQHMKDDLDPLRRARNWLLDGKPKPSAAEDPYIRARLSRGTYGLGRHWIEHSPFRFGDRQNVGKALKDILKPVQADLDGFRDYIVAKRALELHDRGIKTGIPNAAAQKVVADGHSFYEPIREELHEYQDHGLQYLIDAGILDPERAAAMREANQDYVPFFRVMDEQPPGIGKPFNVRNPVHGIKGSGRKIVDPIESIVRNTFSFIDLAERNAVVANLDAMAKAAGERGLEIMKPIKPPVHPVNVTEAEVARFMKENGIEGDPANFTVFRKNALRPERDQVAFFKDGKRQLRQVPEEIGVTINGLDRPTANIVAKILSAPARFLRAGATLAPEFIVRNPMRDQVSAFILSDAAYKPFLNMVTGFAHLVTKDAAYRDWLKSGGANAALVSMDRKYINEQLIRLEKRTTARKALDVIKSPIQALRVLSEATENATRLGDFAKARKGGHALMQAGYGAREVTLDFARMGINGHEINRFVAFWNAQVEGFDRTVRAFGSHPWRTLFRVIAAITAPSIALWAINHKDPRWKHIEKWQRDMFWIVMTDKWENVDQADAGDYPDWIRRQTSTGQWQVNRGNIWKIPKPFELGVVFGSIPERILDAYADKEPSAFDGLLPSIAAAMTPAYIPTIALPFIEQFANWDTFTQRPIIPPSETEIQPEYQGSDFTSDTAKLAAAAVSKIPGIGETSFASPYVLENYVNDWTGTLGRYGLQIADLALHAGGGGETKAALPSPTMADMPLIKAFAVRYPSANVAPISTFYEHYDVERKRQKTFDYLKRKGDDDKAEEVGPGLVDGIFGQEGPLGVVAKRLSKDRKEIHAIYADEDLTPDEKRKQIDQIYFEMIDTAIEGNQTYDEERQAQ